MTDQHRQPSDEAGQTTLIDQLVEADDQRRQLRQSGHDDLLTIELSDQLSPADRAELVRMLECADRLEALAAYDGVRQSPPTRVIGEDSTDLVSDWTEAATDFHIGGYQIVRLIADGGFGSVLLAVDEAHESRLVALKVPRPDIRLTNRLRERFLIEGRAASTLNHPNIVKVHETISDPVTAIVYEYCEGGTLTQRVIPGQPADEKTAIEIVLRLAEALHHAHTRGILHRDVKPGNVMLVRTTDPTDEHAVTLDDGRWIPKLGDFGLAKVIDDSVNQTLSGVVMGTPQFMAPEQAAGRISELGTHTDIFSLGSIFYWLLTGRPPFEGKATLQTLRMVESEEPVAPRRSQPTLSPKTEAVCLKCLRKPIDARYKSAAALADDLKCLLKGEPVTARRPSLRERLNLWGQRNPALAMFTIMLPTAAIAGLVLEWRNNRELHESNVRLDAANQSLRVRTQEAIDAETLAEQQQAHSARTSYASSMQLAQRAFEAGDVKTYAAMLSAAIPTVEAPQDLRGPEWQALWDMGHPPETVIDRFPSAVYTARLSADGKHLAACGADATVRVYDTATWRPLQLIETGQEEVNYAAFSSDGTKIASAGDDGTIKVWDWQSSEMLLRIEAYDDLVYCVHFFDDDTKLASCGRNPVIRLWDAASGAPIQDLKAKGDPIRVEQLDISPSGSVIASASKDGLRRAWTLNDYKPVEHLPAVDGQPVTSVCLFRRGDEDWMLSGTERDKSRHHCSLILEVLGREEQRVLPIHFDGVQSVAVDPAGDVAAAGDVGGRISIIDVNAAIQGPRWWHPQTIRKHWHGHDGIVYGLVVTADGEQVISAGSDGKVSRWSPNEATERTTHLAERRSDQPWVHTVAVAAGVDSSKADHTDAGDVHHEVPNLIHSVYLSDAQMHLHRWDAASAAVYPVLDGETGQPLRVIVDEDRSSGCFAAFNNRLYGRLERGPVCCWEVDDNRAERLWSAEIGEEFPGTRSMVVSNDGRLLAVGRAANPTTIIVLKTSTGDRVAEFVDPEEIANGTQAVAFNPAATHLAYGTGRDVFLGDLQTSAQQKLGSHSGEVRSLAFVPNSPFLLSGGMDRKISIWNTDTGKLEGELVGHPAAIECLGTHSFGDRIVSTDEHGWVRIWTLQDRMLVAEPPPRSGDTRYASVGDYLLGVTEGSNLFMQLLSLPDRDVTSH